MEIDSSTERKIQALLQLLTDPNTHVADTIQRELVTMGEVVLPFLEEFDWRGQDLGPRLTDIREDIRFVTLQNELKQLLTTGGQPLDLEAAIFLLARTAYPNTDMGYYTQQLDGLAEEIRPRLVPSLTQEQANHILCRYLFQEKGFFGNRDHYYDPDNSFLNRVLDRRTGIPITLSVLYLLLSNRLGLSCVGVGMPGHFVVKLENTEPAVFIDCFNGGAFLQKKDCQQFLTDAGVKFDDVYLKHTPNDLIVARMIRNLIGVYEQQQESRRVDRLNGLMTSLEHAAESK
ncbi:SirB1 family protein [Nitrospira sp. M1]